VPSQQADPIVLAVDTSLPQLSVALTAPGAVLGAVALEGRESRNEKLLPAVDWLLRETGVERSAIGLFAVTRGPGSFTGVRIGIATAQGLSVALGQPLCAMTTHEAAAQWSAEDSVLIFGDAGRGEFYVSGFRGGVQDLPPSLLDRAALDRARGQYLASIELGSLLAVGNIALLAAHRARRILSEGRLAEYADVSPVYVRLAEAEVKLRQRTDG
jgi:tRNA threonylcarbamoyl adenosine modification protein YeaZ